MPASVPPPYFQPVGVTIITDLLHKGLLRPTHSPYNSPILAVKKPNGTYCLVQDLRLINNAVKPIHPSSLTLTPFSLLFLPPPLTSLSLISRMPFLPFPSPPSHRTFLPLPGQTHTHITHNNSSGRSSLRVLGIAHICLDSH
jgi:hypothetical protein